MKDKKITLRILAAVTVLVATTIAIVFCNHDKNSDRANHHDPVADRSPSRVTSSDADDSNDPADSFGPPITLLLAADTSVPTLARGDASARAFDLDASGDSSSLLTAVQRIDYSTAHLKSPGATDADYLLPSVNAGKTASEQDAILTVDDLGLSGAGAGASGR